MQPLILVTDITLSCMDDLPHDKEKLLLFLDFLAMMEVDSIELSEQMHNFLQPKNPGLCVKKNQQNNKTRIQGLDDALCGDYQLAFALLKEKFSGGVEFCPTNRLNCATALAVEWLASGSGNEVVTSFGGIGGFAPTEEVIMFLRMNGLRKPSKTYPFLPEMTNLFSEITGKNVSGNKPVIGKKIFHVESGVHVDGILKHPECYEPFPPEAVGQARKIVLGKQSGRASIRAKLLEMNIQCADENISLVLERVKAKAMEKNGEVSDAEFAKIAETAMEQP